jgi:hypothetical protein
MPARSADAASALRLGVTESGWSGMLPRPTMAQVLDQWCR